MKANGFLARFLSALVLVVAVCQAMAGGAQAQSAFSPVAIVGDRIVTQYELDQRVLMLEALNATGDLRKTALKNLVEERLQQIQAERDGVTISDEDLAAGMAEFARRANLETDEFLARLADEGVAAQTFRDFSRAGLTWRRVVQQRFGALAVVSDAEVDAELGRGTAQGTLEFQISEIFLPTNNDRNAEITRQLAPQIAALTSTDEFADAARRFSAGPTASAGGRVERWLPISGLPAALRDQLLTMRVGQVSNPVELDGAVGLFQLRAKREAKAGTAPDTVDFITYQITDKGRQNATQRAASLPGLVDTCLDLYGIAKGEPEEHLTRSTAKVSTLAPDLALALARLDPDEGTILQRDGAPSFVMLCARTTGSTNTAEGDQGVDATGNERETVRSQIFSRKLGAYASNLLDELRGEITIEYK